MPYTPQTWQNEPSTLTPLSAARLGVLEDGIDDAHTLIDGHVADTAGAHAASAISFTPAGSVSAVTVQAAIEEVASEAGGSHPDLATHDALGLATQAELDTHAGAADPHAGYVLESLFDANTILKADSDNTPAALTVGASTFVGRKSSGDIAALTPAEARTELGLTTRRMLLFVDGAIPPDASGTGNNPATLEKIVSSGSQTANTPKVTYVQALFDQSTDEHLMWHFAIPSDYTSGGTVRLLWGAKVTTGDVIWKTGIEAGDASSTDMDAAVFNAADAAAASTVPGTVGQFKETTIALTMTGASAGDEAILFVGRDADAGGDTAAGDATLRTAIFEYER